MSHTAKTSNETAGLSGAAPLLVGQMGSASCQLGLLSASSGSYIITAWFSVTYSSRNNMPF